MADRDLGVKLGALLRSLREKRGTTQLEVAEALAMSEGQVSRRESGGLTTGIPLGGLADHARALGAQVDITLWANSDEPHSVTLVGELDEDGRDAVRQLSLVVGTLGPAGRTALLSFARYLRMEEDSVVHAVGDDGELADGLGGQKRAEG